MEADYDTGHSRGRGATLNCPASRASRRLTVPPYPTAEDRDSGLGQRADIQCLFEYRRWLLPVENAEELGNDLIGLVVATGRVEAFDHDALPTEKPVALMFLGSSLWWMERLAVHL